MLQQVNQTEARDLEWYCQAVSPSTAVSAGGSSVTSMPRMRPGTPVLSPRATKGASCLRQPKGIGSNESNRFPSANRTSPAQPEIIGTLRFS